VIVAILINIEGLVVILNCCFKTLAEPENGNAETNLGGKSGHAKQNEGQTNQNLLSNIRKQLRAMINLNRRFQRLRSGSESFITSKENCKHMT
jgi:hypothetical protein